MIKKLSIFLILLFAIPYAAIANQFWYTGGGTGGAGDVPSTRLIDTTAPLDGGGNLSADRTLSLLTSGVTPGVYVNATVTVDQFGLLTASASGVGFLIPASDDAGQIFVADASGGGAWSPVADLSYLAGQLSVTSTAGAQIVAAYDGATKTPLETDVNGYFHITPTGQRVIVDESLTIIDGATPQLILVESDTTDFNFGISVQGSKALFSRYSDAPTGLTGYVEIDLILSQIKFRQRIDIAHSVSISSSITPPPLSAQTDNWDPVGIGGAHRVRVATTGGNVDITGIKWFLDREVILSNVGTSGAVTLVSGSVASSAANQFLLSANVSIQPSDSVTILYDAGLKWMVISK